MTNIFYYNNENYMSQTTYKCYLCPQVTFSNRVCTSCNNHVCYEHYINCISKYICGGRVCDTCYNKSIYQYRVCLLCEKDREKFSF